MDDLNQKIFKMKCEGVSLRRIAQRVGMSHEGVRKRLMGLEDGSRASTSPEDRKLSAPSIKEEKVSTSFNLSKSRSSEEIKEIVNLNIPSQTLTQGVNYLENPSGKATIGKKGVSQRGFLGIDGLFEAIKGFLEYYGIKFYRLQCEPEAYQIKHGGQIIRFYVQRKIGVDKAKEEME